MSATSPRPDATPPAPPAFRDALAELVQHGLSVSRMLAHAAETETALSQAAAQFRAGEGVSYVAQSLNDAREYDQAAAAAIEARRTVVARAEIISKAYARVLRAIRLTILLAERLDRGWARPGASDNRRAMKRRQIARGVADAIGRETDPERAERLTEALADRLEQLDVEDEWADRPAEDIIRDVCRDIGLDPVRMTLSSPLPDATRRPASQVPSGNSAGESPALTGGSSAATSRGGQAFPPPRRPDG